MRYFLSSIVVFLFFSKVVLANMQDPSPTTNDNSDILMDKKSIHKMIDAGEYEKARSNLKIFIENNSSDHEAYNLLGYVERQ